jgi:hypothetical protein
MPKGKQSQMWLHTTGSKAGLADVRDGCMKHVMPENESLRMTFHASRFTEAYSSSSLHPQILFLIEID